MTNRIIIAAFALVLVSCASADKNPKWVARGSGVFFEGKEPVLYGVGRDEAGARAELAKLVEGFGPAFTAGFMADSKLTGDARADDEQHMGQTIKNLLKFTKNFAVITDRWTDASGNSHVLGRIDANAIIQTVEDSSELDPRALQYVRNHFRRTFAARAGVKAP